MDAFMSTVSSILVPLFFIGVAGSMLVVLITVLRDLGEIFTSDETRDGEL
ncbi:MAG TPA: hypothetical protein VL495_06785 [Edaphobacter sp.]|nr:hypothetical protein [Edaphobacter sp.]